MEKYNGAHMDFLADAILSLESREECMAFMKDLMTIKEMQDLSQRLQVARCLSRGDTFLEISGKLGVSTATITKVNRCCNYGAGGYRLILDRLERHNKQEE